MVNSPTGFAIYDLALTNQKFGAGLCLSSDKQVGILPYFRAKIKKKRQKDYATEGTENTEMSLRTR